MPRRRESSRRAHLHCCAVALLMGVLVGACRAPAPTATPTPSPVAPFVVITGTPTYPALPPTWTPSAVPPTPTPTRTPTPTPTASPEPTLALDALCATFEVVRVWQDGASFALTDNLQLVFGTPVREVSVRFVAVHRLSGEQLVADVPGGEQFGLVLPLARLPRHGLYDFTVSVQSSVYGEVCAQRGYFIVAPPPRATATPAVIVVTATPDAAVMTATPAVIVVTATPQG